MDVILLQKIRNLGNLGDTVSIRPGYGRNYLFPRKMALPATKDNLAVFEARRSELQAASKEREDQAGARADKLRGKSFMIPVRASDEGKLFGSVGPQEIAHAVAEEGYELAPREVTLTEGTIRQVGYYVAELNLHADVACEIEVVVAQQTDMGVNMPVRAGGADNVEAPAEPAEAEARADEPAGEGEEA